MSAVALPPPRADLKTGAESSTHMAQPPASFFVLRAHVKEHARFIRYQACARERATRLGRTSQLCKRETDCRVSPALRRRSTNDRRAVSRRPFKPNLPASLR